MAIVIGIIFDFMWWIIGIGVAICMLVILWGIIKYATSQGDPSRASGARSHTMAERWLRGGGVAADNRRDAHLLRGCRGSQHGH